MEGSKELLLNQQEDTQYGKYLTFFLGENVLGIEIEFVTEIIGMQPITQIPETADYIKGIINLRGKIIPVIDVRLKFRIEPMEYNDRTCIIVVETGELDVGLIVDQVAEVINIDDTDVAPPPSIKSGIINQYIRGVGRIGGEVKLLLDCCKLLDEDNMNDIS